MAPEPQVARMAQVGAGGPPCAPPSHPVSSSVSSTFRTCPGPPVHTACHPPSPRPGGGLLVTQQLHLPSKPLDQPLETTALLTCLRGSDFPESS